MRTTCANNLNADLFISLHANSAANKQASGIETFCLVPSLITPRLLNTSSPQPDTLYHLLFPGISHETARKSNLLAQVVHTSVMEHALQKNSAVVNRLVKHKVAQVLLCNMPSILIELGFLSHAQESMLLADPHYQAALAQGIGVGIACYFATANK